MSRRTSPLVTCVAATGAVLLLTMLVAPAAGEAATIASAGPITEIAVGPTLRCNARYAGDTSLEFFPPRAAEGNCGPIVTRGTRTVAFGGFVPVSQSGVGGSGTSANPFLVSTVACAGTRAQCTTGTAPLVRTDVSYVVGDDFYRTDVLVTGRGASETIGIYQYGDCYMQNSDFGFGFVDSAANGVYCSANAANSPAARIEGFVPLHPGGSYYEGYYSTVLRRITGQPGQPLPNTCDCTILQDNGMALGWTGIALPASGSVQRSFLTAFSPTGVALDPAPKTTIASGPTGTVQTSTATFTFSSTDPTATFECRVDNGPFAPCASPHTIASLANGPHTFDVRATSAAGIVGAPASRSFAVAVAPVGGSSVTDRDSDSIPDVRDNCVTTPNANQADRDKDGIGDACDKSDASVGPTLGKTVVVKVVSGDVFVRLPAGRRRRGGARAARAPRGYVALKGAEVLPVGTIVHAVRGRLALTSAARRIKGRTKTQRAEFFDGIFQIRQRRAKRPVTDLKLRSPSFRKTCGSGARSAGASGGRAGSLRAGASAARKRSKKVVSRLWGSGRGNFRTTGRHSAATVRGTIWLTQERCDGTLTRVTRGVVSVRDLTAGRTVTVRAGQSYLARAVRAGVKARRP